MKIKFIEPTHKTPVTVRDAIYNLPKIGAGEINNYDNLHVTSALSPKNLQRIQHSVPGGTWRDWPQNLILNCHKKRNWSFLFFCLW